VNVQSEEIRGKRENEREMNAREKGDIKNEQYIIQ